MFELGTIRVLMELGSRFPLMMMLLVALSTETMVKVLLDLIVS